MKALFSNPALQRGWRTFIHAFVALFVVYLVPFLTDVINWAHTDGAVFPNASVLAKAAVAALASGMIAVVSVVWNAAEDKAGSTLPTMAKVPNTP